MADNRSKKYYGNPENQAKRARWNREKRAANRLMVIGYLAEHPCVDCGNTDVRVLEFDHVRGVKSKEISRMLSLPHGSPKIMEEIQKCEVRCANCHRIRHHAERDKGLFVTARKAGKS